MFFCVVYGSTLHAKVTLNEDVFFEIDNEPMDSLTDVLTAFSGKILGPYPIEDIPLDKPSISVDMARDICLVTNTFKLEPLIGKKDKRIIFSVGKTEYKSLDAHEHEVEYNGFRLANRNNEDKDTSYSFDIDWKDDSYPGATFSVYQFYDDFNAFRIPSMDNLFANYSKKERKSLKFNFRMVLGSDLTWFEIWPEDDNARKRVNRTVLFTGFNWEPIFEHVSGKGKYDESSNDGLNKIELIKLLFYFSEDPQFAAGSYFKFFPSINSERIITKVTSCTHFKETVYENYVEPVNGNTSIDNGKKPLLPK